MHPQKSCLKRTADRLLQGHANANLMVPPNVVSPLYYLMRVVCAMSPHLLSVTANQVTDY